jgi:hypothetical protein
MPAAEFERSQFIHGDMTVFGVGIFQDIGKRALAENAVVFGSQVGKPFQLGCW